MSSFSTLLKAAGLMLFAPTEDTRAGPDVSDTASNNESSHEATTTATISHENKYNHAMAAASHANIEAEATQEATLLPQAGETDIRSSIVQRIEPSVDTSSFKKDNEYITVKPEYDTLSCSSAMFSLHLPAQTINSFLHSSVRAGFLTIVKQHAQVLQKMEGSTGAVEALLLKDVAAAAELPLQTSTAAAPPKVAQNGQYSPPSEEGCGDEAVITPIRCPAISFQSIPQAVTASIGEKRPRDASVTSALYPPEKHHKTPEDAKQHPAQWTVVYVEPIGKWVVTFDVEEIDVAELTRTHLLLCNGSIYWPRPQTVPDRLEQHLNAAVAHLLQVEAEHLARYAEYLAQPHVLEMSHTVVDCDDWLEVVSAVIRGDHNAIPLRHTVDAHSLQQHYKGTRPVTKLEAVQVALRHMNMFFHGKFLRYCRDLQLIAAAKALKYPIPWDFSGDICSITGPAPAILVGSVSTEMIPGRLLGSPGDWQWGMPGDRSDPEVLLTIQVSDSAACVVRLSSEPSCLIVPE